MYSYFTEFDSAKVDDEKERNELRNASKKALQFFKSKVRMLRDDFLELEARIEDVQNEIKMLEEYVKMNEGNSSLGTFVLKVGDIFEYQWQT